MYRPYSTTSDGAAAGPRQRIDAMGFRASWADPEVELDDGVWLHGRDVERAAIDELLEGARAFRSGVLVFRGEAGVGKSALLGYARTRGADMRILQTVGVEPEIDLPFAALHRLLRPVLAYIDLIPEVQADALRSALAIAPGEVDNRFVIAVAILSLLAELASEQPLLCLIDDAHWLDQSSADALAFVARRLEAEGIVMVFAVRERDGRSFPGSGLSVRRIDELDAAQSESLLVDRFGSDLAPEVRHLIRESAQGNPLALLEIPKELKSAQLAGRERLPRPMPIGRNLEEVFLERVHRLSAPTQMLLLVAAAEGSGEADVILTAGSRLGISPSALVEAEASGLIHADGRALAFRHPILRGAIYQGASLPQRQIVHRSLVDTLSGEADADRRAWHQAALLLHPDDDIADELERTAERARSRSGHSAAAAALRRASELTSSGEGRSRRLAAAARAAWDAGRPDEAIDLLRATETEMSMDTYAEMCHVEGEIELHCGVPLEGAMLLMEGAAKVASSNPRKALEMLFDAAHSANYVGDLALLMTVGRTASNLPFNESEPEAPLVELLTGVASMLEAKDTASVPKLLLALDRVADTTEPRALIWAGAAAAIVGDEARDDTFRRRSETIARRSMAVGRLVMVLERMAWRDIRHGRVSAASLHSEEGLQLAMETGVTNSQCFHRAILSWTAAVRGDEETCNAMADQALDTAIKHGLVVHNSITTWALGLLHLGLGRWEAAVTHLEGLGASGHPYIVLQALPDLVEAGVRADRRDIAESAIVRLPHSDQRRTPDWEMALADRCHGLMTHDPGRKEKFFSRALTYHDRDQRMFARARTLLLLGEHLRRERRRIEARPHLRSAVEIFQRLGASPWETRARAELRATGGRARKREPSTITQLTPQQIHIVRLVAEGATNKEVAAQLFLSPRTVDYHLRNVFVKLGISSRAELIRLGFDEHRMQTG
jgi:DNA-binding CsgD family transcriptional regulator